MELIELAHFKLPTPWKPIGVHDDALALGRMLYRDVADTAQEKLQREICKEHPLYGIECRPIAWDPDTGKDFLFTTSKPETPFVLVQTVWRSEQDSNSECGYDLQPSDNWQVIQAKTGQIGSVDIRHKLRHQTGLPKRLP